MLPRSKVVTTPNRILGVAFKQRKVAIPPKNRTTVAPKKIRFDASLRTFLQNPKRWSSIKTSTGTSSRGKIE